MAGSLNVIPFAFMCPGWIVPSRPNGYRGGDVAPRLASFVAARTVPVLLQRYTRTRLTRLAERRA